MQILDAISQHMTWLSLRQEIIASNVANANTPGYRALGIADFSAILQRPPVGLVATSPGHQVDETLPASVDKSPVHSGGWDKSYSGNDVTLEKELMALGDTGRMMALDAGIARSFHRMILSSLKV